MTGSLEWLKFKKLTISSAGKDVKQLKHLNIDYANVKWYKHSGKQDFLIKLKKPTI